MKKFSVFILLLILSILLSACRDSSVASNELNLFTWSEYVPQTILEIFTEETGIQINYDTYSSNEELMAKLQAGGSGYDLIIPSDYTITVLSNQGMLETINYAQIPNFGNIDPKTINKEFDPTNKYSVPYLWGTSCLVVNTEKVTRPITRWTDLWDPEFIEKIVLLDDSRETIGMVLLSLGYDRNSTDPAQLEQAKQKFLELLPNVRLFDSDSPKTALATGEVWLGLTWNGEASIAHQENPAMDYIFPEEGCGIFYDNLAIPKNAPHLAAAHKFINFVLEPQNGALIIKEFPYSTPNIAALELLKTEDPAFYEAYMEYPATNPSAEQLARTYIIKDVGEATALWDRIWTEVKGGE